MIQFQNIQRRFGAKLAVANLNMQIRPGEIFAFLGPNGAGKTTTIKMLVGLLVPTAGKVLVDGFDVAESPREAKARLGYVPDQPELYDKLSGREFLRFVADIRGMSPTTAAAKTDEMIELFQLTEYVDKLTESYSHGMKQRTAIAAALLHAPQALVLDEPMVGLDPQAMRLVKDLLRHRADQGMSIFISTHTLEIAEQIADQIGVIHQGQLRFLGSVTELQSRLQLRDASLEDLFLAITNAETSPTSLDAATDRLSVVHPDDDESNLAG